MTVSLEIRLMYFLHVFCMYFYMTIVYVFFACIFGSMHMYVFLYAEYETSVVAECGSLQHVHNRFLKEPFSPFSVAFSQQVPKGALQLL